MRKTIVATHTAEKERRSDDAWLNLDRIASVEITSENPDFPIESALNPSEKLGWRAAEKGDQTLRIIFDEPTHVSKIYLEFSETEVTRSQEFTLRWASAPQDAMKEIVRQQWNFSPQGSTSEAEEYPVNLSNVQILELYLRPDLSDGKAVASLLRILVA